MQRLELDFRAADRPSPWAGRLLLVVALAVGAQLAVSYRELREAVLEREARLAELQPRAGAAREVSAEEVAAASESLQRLAQPWGELFAALESAASDRVALLAIQPDPRAGTVTITGDSKDYLAALTYVLNLSRVEALSNVQLVRHEVKSDDPQRPVSFAVSASWGGPRP